MASTKEEAFEAFERHGPDAFTAAQWVDADLPPDKLPDGESAPLISTNKDYLYQLRGDFKAQHQTSEADEGASTSEEAEEATETTEDTEPEPEPEPTPTEPEAAPPDPAPPTNTDGGEGVEVGHEGKEKLSPDGFEDESVASIEPPDGLDLPEGTNPEDFEPEPDSPAVDHDPEPEPEPEPEQSSGGLLSRIRGDSGKTETTEEVVEDAPTEAEGERRQELADRLKGADGGPTPEPEDTDQPTTSTTSQGLVVDEDLVASLFGLPFAQAKNATGWDGWELSDEERDANARLIVAYCDEQNIDLSAGGMLAMSLMSTVGGRVAGYAKHRKTESDDADDGEASASVDRDPEPTPSEETATDGGDEAAPTRSEPTRDEPSETTEADAEAFDLSDSSTW